MTYMIVWSRFDATSGGIFTLGGNRSFPYILGFCDFTQMSLFFFFCCFGFYVMSTTNPGHSTRLSIPFEAKVSKRFVVIIICKVNPSSCRKLSFDVLHSNE